MPKRKFFQYELNWLKKYGFDLNNLDSIGEKPVEYVTGHAEFLGHDFFVSPDTLIPRIETEEIIPLASSFISTISKKHINIADIGTGSGCIGISLADNLIQNNIYNFDIFLSDISPKALEIAQKNSSNILRDNSHKVHLLKSFLLEQYPPDIKFDLIISNLPYIPSKNITELDASVKDFEPLSALDGGEYGTTLINKLLNNISPYLEPIFLIILEIDATHNIKMFSPPKHTEATIKTDSFGRPRFLILTPD